MAAFVLTPRKQFGALIETVRRAGHCVASLLVAVCLLFGASDEGWAGGVSNATAITAGLAPAVPSQRLGPTYEFQLKQYKALGQLDPSIYGEQAIFDEYRNVTCLATVLLMLERANGKPGAKLDYGYWDNDAGALDPGYVTGKEAGFDYEKVKKQITAGKPVILKTELEFPNSVQNHFVLGVGVRETPDGKRAVIAHDPLSGQTIEIDEAGRSAGQTSKGASFKSNVVETRYVKV